MAAPKEGLGRGSVPVSGITVLFKPNEPSVDIVFIHGFTGHPERTWTSKKAEARGHNSSMMPSESPERPSKLRRLNPFPASRYGGGVPNTAVYWPRDLVPKTVPCARVLTYGYDTHLRYRGVAPMNRNTVYDIASDLLVALESERRTEPTRPLLFVVHSLGGIVVKELLRQSRGCGMGRTHLRGIFVSTAGIIFFGTPHAGYDRHGFLHVAEKVVKAAGFSANEQIVKALLPSSERLRELRDEFGPMAQDRSWTIHSFQEQVGIGPVFGQKVVDDTSSSLSMPAIEIAEHIGRNHMEMCRFAGVDDTEYKKVAAALCRIMSTVSKQRTTAEQSLGAERKRVLLDSLLFEQIDARHMGIKKAHAKTCQWLLKMSEYLDWLDPSKLGEHHGFLWIKGNPGTGKSTLMKFVLANAQKKMKDTTIISFFFNARGDDLEKSTIGMYRSLLWQLLERLPALQDVFDFLESATRASGCPQWSIESLKALFEQAIHSLGESSLACFIDALDECDERQIRDMISFFEHLGKLTTLVGIRFRVCFSSRHYPHIEISEGLGLILEGQEGHDLDIVSYLNSELKIGHSKLAETIRIDLQEKASGVFIWVVLVVEILNKEHDGGRIHSLRKRLRDIPGDLHELFRDILTRDQHNRGELLLCIQWVLFARQPLKPEQLYFAILSGSEPEVLSEWDPDEITSTVMGRFILDSSKGLAEITKSKVPMVQFIHESVKDFLLKENGLQEIWSGFGGDLQGESHERLKQCCLNYTNIDIAMSLGISGSLPPAKTMIAAQLRQLANQKFPFLEYATKNVLYHANAAQESGVSQLGFLQSFRLTDWIQLDNLFEKHEIRRYTPNASFLYILSERNMAALIRVRSSKQSCFDVEEERYGTPIFAALATDSNEAVESLVEPYSEMQPHGSLLRDLCRRFSETRNKCDGFGRDFIFSPEKGALYYVVEQDDLEFLAFFIAAGQSNAEDCCERTPLSYAAERGHEDIVQQLLKNGVDVISKHKSNRTPLWYAAARGHEAVVRLLLDNGANIDSKDNESQNALWPAAKNGHQAVVRLLLKNGADVKSKDSSGRTALFHAAANKQETIVQLLLESDADIDSKDDKNQTALGYAAENGYQAIVRLLLTNGADVKSKDKVWGKTPLSWAASTMYYDTVATVKLLLAKGADLESRCTSGRTPLSWAAENSEEAVVELLLNRGANAESRCTSGRTPLSWAAENSEEAVVELLLNRGANVESRCSSGRTPLSWATANSEKAVFELLLNRGANVESRCTSGRTPLSWAAENSEEAVFELLLNRGANVESRCTSGRTPLSWAISTTYCGTVATVKLLLAKGADLESRCTSGRTPLSWAISTTYYGTVATVKLLLAKGADLESRCTSGRTPLSWAAENSEEAVFELLLNRGANVESRCSSGRTPLSWAASTMYYDTVATVKLLLAKGADLESRCTSGRTPLSWAVENSEEAVVELLLNRGANVESRCTSGLTPLQWAEKRQNHGMVEVLKSRGAQYL